MADNNYLLVSKSIINYSWESVCSRRFKCFVIKSVSMSVALHAYSLYYYIGQMRE